MHLRRRSLAFLILAALAMGACAAPSAPAEISAHTLPETQEAFWASLQALCGQAFAGTDERVARVMHVRHCSVDEIQIPLHVDDDRSRTWIVTRQPDGLRLKHDHREEDGAESEVTQYGGDTEDVGTANIQEFHADAFTAELLPAAAGNMWTMHLEPGATFAYQLERYGEFAVRWEFDLANPVEAPPAPWGYEHTQPTH